MKKRIRLTESDLHRIIKNAVRRVIREANQGYRTLGELLKIIGERDLDVDIQVDRTGFIVAFSGPDYYAMTNAAKKTICRHNEFAS